MTWQELKDPETPAPKPPTKEEFLLAKVFNSDEGKQALAYLKTFAFEKKPLVMLNDGINTAIIMAMREGEINFYRKIEQTINKIENYAFNQSR